MNENEYLKLDNQICFALYVCSKEIIKKYRPLLEPLNLTYTSYIAMLSLWEKDGVTVKELGDTLFLDSGTLTPLLKKLEITGYISTKRDTHDERNLRIYLTEKGKELKVRAEEIPGNLLCSIYTGNYCDSSEMIKLRDTLHKLMRKFLASEKSDKT